MFRLYDVLEYRDTHSRRAHKELEATLFVPENVDFESILHPSRVHLADRARYFVHLTYRRMQQQERDPYLQASTVRLKAKYFRKLLTKLHYRRILDDLEEAGVVYVLRKLRRKRCYKYGFGPVITKSQPSFVRYFPRDRRLQGLIRRSLDKRNLIGQRCPICRRLSDDLRKVEILATEAKEWLRHHRKDLPNYDAHDLAIERIARGDFYCSPSETKRVHHNVTNLSRDCRQFLRVDGCRLVELDIANSQPLLVGLLCMQSIGANAPWGVSRKNKQDNRQNEEPLRCPVLRGIADADTLRYVEAGEQGKIYELLQDACVSRGVTLSRDEIKKRLFKRFFFIGYNIPNEPIVEVFKTEFPTIYDFVISKRKRHKSQLARIMQQMEAEIVIHGVLGRLQQIRPDDVFLTIHDSILTTQKNAKLAKQVMEEEFAKLGVNVLVKAKCPENHN
ncbi:hypothetical protein DTL42_18455 [Bremerella cremea]|uniref:Uncharacterized protein n=1 Tax=Bremerella cremea TaxID=1031537 RepID=A0A368KMN9_9BACT|nr:hypothetical protein [Bremerella cremea]RCS43967.1 hypothetical protein DTL42_18455 [Bremerella cremea]